MSLVTFFEISGFLYGFLPISSMFLVLLERLCSFWLNYVIGMIGVHVALSFLQISRCHPYKNILVS